MVEGLHMVVVVLEKAPLVQKAVAVQASPTLAPVGQPHGLGQAPPPDLLRPQLSRSLLLGRLLLLQLFHLVHVSLNFILKQN